MLNLSDSYVTQFLFPSHKLKPKVIFSIVSFSTMVMCCVAVYCRQVVSLTRCNRFVNEILINDLRSGHLMETNGIR